MMTIVTNRPLLVFAITFVLLLLAELLGTCLVRGREELDDQVRERFSLVIAAALTLLGLIIGFSFSMATSRYDQRKSLEEAEANAIGTEYVRADFLTPADAEQARTLLREYLEERIQFYQAHDEAEVAAIDARTARLQDALWGAVRGPAEARQTPILALVVSGMNDVLNSQGYTQAAWWNRIPHAAWGLMVAIAVCCGLLLGYGAHRTKVELFHMVVLPLVVSISLFLIADIDSPRGGVIRVQPQNLLSLAQALRPR